MPKKGYKQTEEHKQGHLIKIRRSGNGNWKNGIKIDNLILYQRAKTKRWEQRNKEKVSQKRFRYRERLRNIIGWFTLEDWSILKSKYNNTCPKCGLREPVIKLTRDHIVPISKGGTNFISNIQPLCGSCNSSKKDKIINRFELSGEAR